MSATKDSRVKESSVVVQHQLHPEKLHAFDMTQPMTGVSHKFKNPEA